MKRLFLIVITLFLLGIMGFFATQNNHIVSLKIYENFSIKLSAWILIVLSFISGWALTEIWQFFSNPNRFVKIFFRRLSLKKEEKTKILTQNFEEASLLRDSKQVIKNYKKLDNKQIPISLHVEYIWQLRYENSKEELLKKFAELRSEYQGNLEVLLPYLKLVCEVREWELAERLAQEIVRLNPMHPDAMEGLRKCYIARKDWVSCIEQERDLLENFEGSFFTEDLALEHENHLQKALIQDPNCLKNWSFGYLSKKRDRINEKKLEVLGDYFQLKKSGSFLETGKFLKKAYKKFSFPELLEELENLYFASGGDEQILDIIGDLHDKRKNSITASIVFAKLLYKNCKLDEAKKVLNEIQVNENTSNFELKEKNEKWHNLYYALRFFIAIRQDSSEAAVNEAKSLLREGKYL